MVTTASSWTSESGVASRALDCLWRLAELVRYLEHPRSGAAKFDDMGMAWVPVREAVTANTLRAADRKIGAVTASWGKLVRNLALQMTSQLGVTVTPVLPRKLARDHANVRTGSWCAWRGDVGCARTPGSRT